MVFYYCVDEFLFMLNVIILFKHCTIVDEMVYFNRGMKGATSYNNKKDVIRHLLVEIICFNTVYI